MNRVFQSTCAKLSRPMHVLASRAFPLVSETVPMIPSVTSTYYHTSAVAMAKPKKGGGSKKGGSGGGDNDDASDGPALPELSSVKASMEITIDRFTVDLSKIKVGKISTDLFNDIKVPSYGPVSSAGQVVVKSPTMLTVAVYDPSAVKLVAEAIQDCGQGYNPVIENNVVSVFIPKPSKESRELVIKNASKLGEKV
jgi:ribosome recycling factor